MQTLKKVFSYMKKYSILLVIAIIFAAIQVVLSLYFPILVGDAIDEIIKAKEVHFDAMKIILLQAVVVVVIAAAAQYFMSVCNNRLTFHMIKDVRMDAFSKLEKLPLSYMDSHSHGDIVSRMIADVDTFAEGLLLGFSQLFTGVATILGTLVFMFRLNVKIALLVVLVTPLSLFVASFISKKTYNMFGLQSKTRGEQTSLIDEMIGNQKVVQAFGYETKSFERFKEVNDRLGVCSLRATFFSSLTNPSTRFVNAIVYAIVAVVGAFTVISTGGLFSIGNLTCFLSYANQYTKPFNEISSVITEFQNALACADRIFTFIEEAEVEDNENTCDLGIASGKVSLESVCFSYDKNKKLIEDLTLYVEPGQRVAIVGPTGCGKTTLINLLMRFYDIDEGKISIDDKDIYHVTRDSLRRNYGMVLQETWLQKGTIRDNIRMGKPDATDEEVIEAAKSAHAHSFIRRLPKGYDTVIGEDGGSLSQGQKQLLCIARIMIALPPMLILDEATSSIDTRTEMKIQKAFNQMMEGRTSFIVAHRLSTIREADVILVMKDGKIIEQGTHDSLLLKNGFYANLYNSQFLSSFST